MFIFNREELLVENENVLSTILEIIGNMAGYCVLGENRNIISIWTKDNKDSFTAIIKDNKIKIVKINKEKCDIVFAKSENHGYVKNNDLDFRFEYNIEDLDDDITKVAVLQKLGKSTFYQSYLSKNYDALMIMYGEELEKDKVPPYVECDGNFCTAIANTNLMNVSEEKMLLYAENQALGEQEQYEEIFYDDDDDKDFYIKDESFEDDNENESVESENEFFEEDEYNEDHEFEEEEQDEFTEAEEAQFFEECEEEYDGFIVTENGKVIEGIDSYEMIEDVYSELINLNIYLDEVAICNIEDIFDQIKELSIEKEDFNKANDFNNTDKKQDR